MKARLLLDEHFDRRVQAILSRKGFDIVHLRDTCEDKSGDGIADEQVLDQAIREKRVLVTDNVCDFRPLAAAKPWHYGVVLCPVYVDPKRKAEAIEKTLDEHRSDTNPAFCGQVLRIPAESSSRTSPSSQPGVE